MPGCGWTPASSWSTVGQSPQPQALVLLEDGKPARLSRNYVHSQEGVKIESCLQ